LKKKANLEIKGAMEKEEKKEVLWKK